MRKSVVFVLVLATMFLLGTSNAGAGNGQIFWDICACETGCINGVTATIFGGRVDNDSDIPIVAQNAQVSVNGDVFDLFPVSQPIGAYDDEGFATAVDFPEDIIWGYPSGEYDLTCTGEYSYDVNGFDLGIENENGGIYPIETGYGECEIPVCTIDVYIDIRPQSCPNPLNANAKGVLPVAILTIDDFDATTVDPESVRLAGVAPLRWSVKDVATPFNGIEINGCSACTEEGPDGYMDLTLKFDAQEIVAALADSEECPVLSLTGNLMEEYGGTPIQGYDTMWVTPNVDGD